MAEEIALNGISMSQTDSDRRLNRFSTIVELITNLGTIGSWILGAGSAYVLNIQKTPIVVPGINFVLDVYFQFALILCSILAYIHFLQLYWSKNNQRLSLSNSFLDFVFWDLPRLKQPILLIPVILLFTICMQISFRSLLLPSIVSIVIVVVTFIIFLRVYYHLSVDRKHEKLIEAWVNDDEWMEKWIRRIRAKLEIYGNVGEDDLYESGKSRQRRADTIEIRFALAQYFRKYEFEEDLILIDAGELPMMHPKWHALSKDWVLLERENLNARANYDS